MRERRELEKSFFEELRQDFPALKRRRNGRPLAYLDGPAGTQVPQAVIDAVAHYYRTCNANTEGQFFTSKLSDRSIRETRRQVAAFLNAASWREISFGANMTSLAFALSHAFARVFSPGEEVVITQLDHEANRGPWLALRERGLIVREASMTPTGELDYGDLEGKINSKTRLVAVGAASNALGTVNDIRRIGARTRSVGAWLLVDAVHFAPHYPIDVQAWEADFLLCSAYKFYGPHVGILYARREILESLPVDRLRTQHPSSPERVETGTLNHAALAGVGAALRYLARLGAGPDLRTRLASAMERIASYEHHLACRLYQGLAQIKGVRLYGPRLQQPRTPTISFTVAGVSPREVARRLDRKGLQVWDGHFFALRPVEILGLAQGGGLVRVGISLYNTLSEVDRLLEEIRELASD